MKYPISNVQKLLREMTCTAIGHKWKCSWRRKSNYHELIELPYDSFSYRDKKINAYFEYSAGWTRKCTRCRISIYNPRYHEPVFKQLFFGLRYATRTVVVYETQDFISNKNKNIYTFMFSFFIVPLHTFVMYQDWLWPQISSWTFDVYDWFIDKIEGQHDREQ